MTVTGETAFLIMRARSYMASVRSELDRCSSDPYAANTAAFNLAMAAELTLKHVLLTNSIEPPRTHNHAQLIRECGAGHIPIPKALRGITIDLRTWESTTRYDSGVIIAKEDVEKGYDIVKDHVDKVYSDFITNAYDLLKNKLSLENETKEEAVIHNLRYL